MSSQIGARLELELRERRRLPQGARVVFDSAPGGLVLLSQAWKGRGWWLLDGVRAEWLGANEREATARILGLARDGRRR